MNRFAAACWFIWCLVAMVTATTQPAKTRYAISVTNENTNENMSDDASSSKTLAGGGASENSKSLQFVNKNKQLVDSVKNPLYGSNIPFLDGGLGAFAGGKKFSDQAKTQPVYPQNAQQVGNNHLQMGGNNQYMEPPNNQPYGPNNQPYLGPNDNSPPFQHHSNNNPVNAPNNQPYPPNNNQLYPTNSNQQQYPPNNNQAYGNSNNKNSQQYGNNYQYGDTYYPPKPKCGSYEYDTYTQGCCDGLIFDKATIGCCGSEIYLKAKQGCCSGYVYDKV